MLGSWIDTGVISCRLDGLFSALALTPRLPLLTNCLEEEFSETEFPA